MAGWIKIDRDIRNHWIYSDPVKFRWWIDMLLTANYEDKKVTIGFQLFDCKRGECLMSLKSWADRWRVSKTVVNKFFQLLQKDHMIEVRNETVTTRITICNYESYQQVGNAEETQRERNENATKTQQFPTKEEEEYKEFKEDILGGKTSKKTDKKDIPKWRTDFNEYMDMVRNAYAETLSDAAWVKKQQEFYPNVNIAKSIEKSCVNFWATPAGWKHKKASKSKELDWKQTFAKAISFSTNKVYN